MPTTPYIACRAILNKAFEVLYPQAESLKGAVQSDFGPKEKCSDQILFLCADFYQLIDAFIRVKEHFALFGGEDEAVAILNVLREVREVTRDEIVKPIEEFAKKVNEEKSEPGWLRRLWKTWVMEAEDGDVDKGRLNEGLPEQLPALLGAFDKVIAKLKEGGSRARAIPV